MSTAKDTAEQLALPGIPGEAEADWVWTEEGTDDMESLAFSHTTVMKSEVTQALLSARADGAIFVDVTLGGGGHTEAMLEADPGIRMIALDRDLVALEAARARLARFEGRVTFVHAPFGTLKSALESIGVEKVMGLCADLGVSSPQLDEASRGLSFRREGPLDMRMDQSQGETALEMIARIEDDELANIIFQYGEERRSRRIARSIKRALADGELTTTLDLRRAVVRAVGPVRVGGVDPATRTFQALRIAVNEELGELDSLIAGVDDVIAPGGVVALISFHSLEDRAIKHGFAQRDGWTALSKKPLYPTEEEQAANTRSRSAKLRLYRRDLEEEVEEDS
jgi:16S rRNA (cytosine1402-N4)-methyltransferase